MSIADALDRIGEWPAGMRRGLLALIALACFMPGFMSLPPVDRDESRFAQATKQMVQTGDYIDIRFQDKPRHKKPAGIYWLQATAVHLTGIRDEIWVYRLPSLIAGVASVLLTAAIGGLLFGAGTGFGAGVVMATSVLLNVEARTGKTDATLLALTLAALWFLLLLIRRPAHAAGSEHRSSLGFWLFAGLGFLVKGPILFLPVVGLAAANSRIVRGLGWLTRLRPLTGLPLFLIVALPWFVAIMVLSDGGFLAESVGKDMVAKVAGGQESHGAPPGLYLALLPITFWPFSLLFLLALPWIWRHRRDEPVFLLLGWALVTWIVFALTPTKLAHYVLPAYPALAILAVAALRDGALPALSRWWRGGAFGLWALVTLALAGAMPFVATGAGATLSVWHFGGVLLLPVLWFAWRMVSSPAQAGTALGRLLIPVVLFSGIVFGIFLPGLDPVFVSPRLAAAVAEQRSPACPAPHLITAGYAEPSLVFLTATDTLLTGGQDAAAVIAAGADRCTIVAVEGRQQRAFLDALTRSGAKVEKVDEVTGFNYAKGKRVVISLYRPVQP